MGVTQEKGRVAHIADLLANFCLSVSWQTQSLKLLHRVVAHLEKIDKAFSRWWL